MKACIERLTYHVVPETGTVTCILRGKLICNSSQHLIKILGYPKSIVVTATSKCDPDDKFVLERGKALSRERAKEKFFLRAEEISKDLLVKAGILKDELETLTTKTSGKRVGAKVKRREVENDGREDQGSGDLGYSW